MQLPIFNQLISQINSKILPNLSREQFLLYCKIIEEKDAPILASALSAKADRLLSLNTKDFTQEVANKQE